LPLQNINPITRKALTSEELPRYHGDLPIMKLTSRGLVLAVD